MTIEPKTVTALIGPSGCGKSTFLRSLNRHARGRARRPHRPGQVLLDDQDIYAADVDPVGLAPHRRHGLPAAQPVPDDVDLRQRRRRPEAQRRSQAVRPRRRGRAGAHGRPPVGRGEGPAEQAGARPVRRPAAAAVHRPGDRRRARGAADGRALLGARPDLDAGDRGPHRGAQGPLHDRDRHPQHAAGQPRQRVDRLLHPRRRRRAGRARRVRRDQQIFSTPSEKRTEDYITGRVG